MRMITEFKNWQNSKVEYFIYGWLAGTMTIILMIVAITIINQIL